jgi:hypothetical protein
MRFEPASLAGLIPPANETNLRNDASTSMKGNSGFSQDSPQVTGV